MEDKPGKYPSEPKTPSSLFLQSESQQSLSAPQDAFYSGVHDKTSALADGPYLAQRKITRFGPSEIDHTGDLSRQNTVPQITMAERMERLVGAPVSSESMANPKKIQNDLLAQELEQIFSSFEKSIELRAKYMHLSMQFPGDNPKDLDSWQILPLPPKPSYPPQLDAQGNELPPPPKEEFEFKKYEIPGIGSEDVFEINLVAI
jgi:hypothetical protein